MSRGKLNYNVNMFEFNKVKNTDIEDLNEEVDILQEKVKNLKIYLFILSIFTFGWFLQLFFHTGSDTIFYIVLYILVILIANHFLSNRAE